MKGGLGDDQEHSCRPRRYPGMKNSARAFVDRLYASDSVITLLGKLDVSKFPWEERIAVGVCKARATKEWISIYCSQIKARRINRLQRVGPAAETSSLSSYLVNRDDAERN